MRNRPLLQYILVLAGAVVGLVVALPRPAEAVACARELELDEEIVNVYGSGISLGHPIAATGARMVTSAIYELRRRGGGIGVLSMCAGGGMGAAMVIEVV